MLQFLHKLLYNITYNFTTIGWSLAMVDTFIAVHDLTRLTTVNDFVAIPALQQENWLTNNEELYLC